MKDILKETWQSNLWMRILTISSILLIIASFIIPPTGVIDSSVLAATGELEVFGILWIVMRAIEKGTGASIKRGNVEMEIKDRENK